MNRKPAFFTENVRTSQYFNFCPTNMTKINPFSRLAKIFFKDICPTLFMEV